MIYVSDVENKIREFKNKKLHKVVIHTGNSVTLIEEAEYFKINKEKTQTIIYIQNHTTCSRFELNSINKIEIEDNKLKLKLA